MQMAFAGLTIAFYPSTEFGLRFQYVKRDSESNHLSHPLSRVNWLFCARNLEYSCIMLFSPLRIDHKVVFPIRQASQDILVTYEDRFASWMQR